MRGMLWKFCIVYTTLAFSMNAIAVANATTPVEKCPEEARQVGQSLKTWKYIMLFVPASLALIALALAIAVAWLSIFVYWRQLAAVEKLSKQMMDMAMSASLPEIVLEKATAVYGSKQTLKGASMLKSLSSHSKSTSANMLTAKSATNVPTPKSAVAKSKK